MSDYDCELTHYCWYKTPEKAKEDKKECLKMYSQELGTEFGYSKSDAVYKYNMYENIDHGKFCKSGVGLIQKE